MSRSSIVLKSHSLSNYQYKVIFSVAEVILLLLYVTNKLL